MQHHRLSWDFRTSLVFSAAIHALLLGWFWTHRPQVIEISLPGSYTVDLVGGASEPVAAAPQEKLVSNPPVPLRRDEVTTSSKKVKATAKAAEPAPRPVTRASIGPQGPPSPPGAEAHIGLSGPPGAVSDFPFAYYLISVRNAIARNYYEPQLTRRVRATIVFHIRRDGTVEDASVETPSGVPLFDQAALRAVLASSPLPRLPADFKQDRVRLLFDFEKVAN